MIITSQDGTQQIEFGYPDIYTRPGMWISGGADSAVLLYMLVTYLRDSNRDSKITLFTCANDEKLRWNASTAAAVIDRVIQLTGTTAIDKHQIIYRDRQAVEYFHAVDDWAFNSGTIDILLSGKTLNPLNGGSVIVEDSYGRQRDLGADPYRARDRENPTEPPFHAHEVKAFYNPFLHVDKKLVAAAYDRWDLRQTLLPLTRSCEALPKTDEDGSTIIPPPCGDCWWCLERKWAFGSW